MADTYTIINGHSIKLVDNGDGTFSFPSAVSTNIIGNVGIDQTTAGTTNGVVTKTGSVTTATLAAETSKNIGAVRTAGYPFNVFAADLSAAANAIPATNATLTSVDTAVKSITTTGGIKKIVDALPAGTNLIGRVEMAGDTLLEQLTEADATNNFETASLTVTAACSTSGNVTVTLNEVDETVAIVGTDDINGVATKIRAASFSGWTTGGADAVVTFTCDTSGNKTDATYAEGSTGATGTMTTSQQGTDPALTFSDDIEAIECYNTDSSNAGVFTVNGIAINIPASGLFKSLIEGTAGDTVTVTGATTYIVSRYE